MVLLVNFHGSCYANLYINGNVWPSMTHSQSLIVATGIKKKISVSSAVLVLTIGRVLLKVVVT